MLNRLVNYASRATYINKVGDKVEGWWGFLASLRILATWREPDLSISPLAKTHIPCLRLKNLTIKSAGRYSFGVCWEVVQR